MQAIASRLKRDPLFRDAVVIEGTLLLCGGCGVWIFAWSAFHSYQHRFGIMWLGFAMSTMILGVIWRHLEQPSKRRAERLRLWLCEQCIRDARVRQLSDRQLQLALLIASRPLVSSLDDLKQLCSGSSRKLAEALIDDLPALTESGLVRFYKFESEPRYEPRPGGEERARAELERREALLEAPGPRLGPRSRSSGLAERTI